MLSAISVVTGIVVVYACLKRRTAASKAASNAAINITSDHDPVYDHIRDATTTDKHIMMGEMEGHHHDRNTVAAVNPTTLDIDENVAYGSSAVNTTYLSGGSSLQRSIVVD